MYIDYLNAIVRYYEERKNKSDLPQRFLQPSPSKIRKECVFVYKSRFVNKDKGMLKTFFEVYSETDLLKIIAKFDLGKFKPLANYLKGDTIKPDNKNIELLGWLLDFPKRPFDATYNYEFDKKPSTVDDIKDIEEGVTGGDDNHTHTDRPEIKKNHVHSDPKEMINDNISERVFKQKKYTLVAGIFFLLGVGTIVYFINIRNTAFGVVSPGQKECMVWIDDHYVRVSCDSPGRVGEVWPLDKSRLNNLYRIKQPDTITEKHIGKLWYQKRGSDSLDYYTAGGKDPNNPNRDLKRLSWHIFEKNLSKKVQ